MARKYIKDKDGNYRRDKDGNRLFWSDSDGDNHNHQTVYKDTRHGAKEVKKSHYDPDTGNFHKK